MGTNLSDSSVRWIVAFAAGGANDTTARVMGQYLSDYFGSSSSLVTGQAPVAMSCAHRTIATIYYD